MGDREKRVRVGGTGRGGEERQSKTVDKAKSSKF